MDAHILQHSEDGARVPASAAQIQGRTCDHRGCYLQSMILSTTSFPFNTQLPHASSTGPALHYEEVLKFRIKKYSP